MKKISIITLTLLLLTGCVSSNLKVSPDHLKANVKTILVLPVYIDNDVLPKYPEQLSEFDFTKEERAKIYATLNDSKPQINDSVNELLSRGKYSFKVINYSGKNYSFIKKTETESPVRGYRNVSFAISQNDIIKLTNQYNADAILFHYVQAVKETRKVYLDRNSYTILPITDLYYFPFLYDNKGTLLLGNERKFLSLLEMAKKVDYNKYMLSKIELQSVLSDLEKEFTKDTFAKTIGITDSKGILSALY